MGESLRWVFFVDGMPFDGETIRTKGLGGSETAGYYISRGLAERGHEVHIFCKCPQEGTWNGVRYHNTQTFIPWVMAEPYDVIVVQRVHQPWMLDLWPTAVRLWHMHDLALRRFAEIVRGVLHTIDRILVVSEWMKAQYQEVYGLDPSLVVPTKNGIDLKLVESVAPPLQREQQIVFTARPERGMDIFLADVLPKIIQRVPDVTVKLAGYENYVEQLAPLYQRVQQLVASYGGRVKHLGALAKPDLYRLYKSSKVYTYPSDFEEVSCITAMECAACGLPFVGSARGALPETCIPDATVLIPHDEKHLGARNPEYIAKFVDETVSLLTDTDRWRAMSELGRDKAVQYAWEGVCKQWEDLALSLRADPDKVIYE